MSELNSYWCRFSTENLNNMKADCWWPWWESGSNDNSIYVCVACRYPNENIAISEIKRAFGQDIEFSFIHQQKSDWSPFNTRFENDDWMKWPDGFVGISDKPDKDNKQTAQQIIEQCIEFISDSKQSITIIEGNRASGKTTLICSLLKEISKEHDYKQIIVCCPTYENEPYKENKMISTDFKDFKDTVNTLVVFDEIDLEKIENIENATIIASCVKFDKKFDPKYAKLINSLSKRSNRMPVNIVNVSDIK